MAWARSTSFLSLAISISRRSVGSSWRETRKRWVEVGAMLQLPRSDARQPHTHNEDMSASPAIMHARPPAAAPRSATPAANSLHELCLSNPGRSQRAGPTPLVIARARPFLKILAALSLSLHVRAVGRRRAK